MKISFERVYSKDNTGKDVEYDIVRIQPDLKHADTVEYRMDELKITRPAKYEEFAQAYEQFRTRFAPLVDEKDGMDIRLLPFLTPLELKTCQDLGLRTAEDCILHGDVLKDHFVARYPLLEKQINTLLSTKQGNSEGLIERISSLEEQNALLIEQIQEIKEEKAALSLELKALKDEDKKMKKAS